MRFISTMLISILTIIILTLLSSYFVLQTQWAARHLSNWITQHNPYQLSFEKISHQFSHPQEIHLKGVKLTLSGQPLLENTELILTLHLQQLTSPLHFNTICLENGLLKIPIKKMPSSPLIADNVTLTNMQVAITQGKWHYNAKRVYGGITPRLQKKEKTQFQFSSESLTFNKIPINHLFIKGDMDGTQINIHEIGADIAQGQLVGNALSLKNNYWQIKNLTLTNFHWQSKNSLKQFILSIKELPLLKLGHVEIIGAKIEGTNWALNNFDLSLHNITWNNDKLQGDGGQILFNANDIVLNGSHFINPLFSADLMDKKVTIHKFITQWNKGIINANGLWEADNTTLTLNNMNIANLEYSLPQIWKAWWNTTFPWIQNLLIKNLNIERNLIIDINPKYPFQFTALEGLGENLQLIRKNHWGIWQGNLNLRANNATLNKVDLRQIFFSLQATDQEITIKNLSAISQQGLLEASGNYKQENGNIDVHLVGQKIPSDQLIQWGWPKLPISGDVNMTLILKGTLINNQPLKPTINASLNVYGFKGEHIEQTMTNGAISKMTHQ